MNLMNTEVIDERELLKKFQEDNIQRFLKFIKDYDNYMSPIMRAQGYKLKNNVSRTVMFTFGEVEFFRNRWYKNNQCKIPVDEKLGLSKHERLSKEMTYQVAHLSTFLPYRKVGNVLELITQSIVTKDTVLKAVKTATKLLKDKEDYDYYNEEKVVKQTAKIIYLEGDGVMIKTTDQKQNNWNTDLSHFVVHVGSQKVGANRWQLQQKKEFISTSNRKVREQVLDYLYQNFKITDQTILISNSDGGHGYTPYIFNEIAKALKIKRHEHFWDKYHVNKLLTTFFKPYPKKLLDTAFQSLKQHNRGKLRTVLDTTEGLIVGEEEQETFETLKKKVFQNFQYTKPAKLRGLSEAGIGIMESQHRKITYRMKKRGMYWSPGGVETMSQMIIARTEGYLKDLFMGNWRNDYQEQVTHFKSVSHSLKEIKEVDSSWLQRPNLKMRRLKLGLSAVIRKK